MVTVVARRSLPRMRRQFATLADVQRHLGDVPAARIIANPAPGTATEEDIFQLGQDTGLACELIDGILVAKPMGAFESILASVLNYLLMAYLENDPIGFVTGEQGPARTIKRRVRMPDVGFFLNEHLSADAIIGSISENPPDLAVEILSPSNTAHEMDLKLAEYFKAGTTLVWYIYPPTKTARLYTSPKKFEEIGAGGYLDGRNLLPGFRVRLGEVFERAERLMKPRAGRKSKKK